MAPGIAAVTGGARGIGLAYATALLQRGWKVALLDLSGYNEAATALGPNAIGIECDVANAASFTSATDTVEAKLGPINLLINNAGVVGLMFSDMEKQVNVNLVGALRGTELAIARATKKLTQRADPPLDIICTASSNGLVPADGDCAPVYCATKFGIIGMVRALAFMGPRFGVRVVALCPVTVETPMTQPYLPPEARGFLEQEGRGGVLPPEACAKVLLRVLDTPSPELSGEVLTVHPAVVEGYGGPQGQAGQVLSLDTGPGGSLAHLGVWQASRSAAVREVLEGSLGAVAKGEANGWSTAK